MSFGIYKPGQGYWVRVMTAGLIALITVATAAWLWNQSTLIAERLPKAGWSLDLRSIPPELKPGETLTLLNNPGEGFTPSQIGTGRIKSITGQTVLATDLAMTEKNDPTQIGFVQVGPSELTAAAAAEPTRVSVQRRTAMPLIEPTLFSGVIASIVIIIGAIIGYWLVGVRQQTVEFLIATDFEMKRVNWSTRREIMGSTVVVIFVCVVVTGLLFTYDRIFEAFFKLINVLPK